MADDDAWAELAERFVDRHYASLRGRVRTHVIHQHLVAHLPPPPARIVDVGGGAGNQSIPLAGGGYAVTIVDPSAAMLERAGRRLRDEGDAVADRVRLVRASGEEAPAVLDGDRFDAVLCHGVLMYVDDPEPLVDALCRLAGPGALMSIVAKNARTRAVRPALAGDWAAALTAFDSDRQVNGLGVDTRADRVEHLAGLLEARGVETVAWYGVRLFTDGWAPDVPATRDDDLLLEVELQASRRDPYRQLSRLFHVVARHE
jgi:SAM-dependent methyltransferase